MNGKKISGRLSINFLAVVVFLSAFLLFISEPLIGRILLPSFGGSAQVWLVCVMFFQGMLLLGYLYAHYIANKIGFWHILLLILPLINLPFNMGSEPNLQRPTFSLLFILFIRFALPFIALSTTAVVIQLWLSQSYLSKTYEPYPLYAASNAGSMIALFSYAFIFEPTVGIKRQTFFWSFWYLIFIILMVISAYLLRNGEDQKEYIVQTKNQLTSESGSHEVPTLKKYGIWFLLSCLPSAFLLAVTNLITFEIGSFPMIWILPLALYLGSFIVTFRQDGKIPRIIRILWPEILLLATLFYFIGMKNFYAIFGCLMLFFAICVMSHGKLFELRPSPKCLTNFYLTIAVGGFVGGVLVTLIAPVIFKGLYEYIILLLLFGIVFLLLQDVYFKSFWAKISALGATLRVMIILVVVSLVSISAGLSLKRYEKVRYRRRNFYGIYKIIDENLDLDSGHSGIRLLMHGNTLHGAQMLDPSKKMVPITYYYQGGNFADVYDLFTKGSRNAVIGLGAGVISTYLNENDTITYYEIDPDNYKIAKEWFTYLDDCKSKLKVIVGDGRLSIKNSEKDGYKYDLITIDAFSGDGIPMHLLTKEAIEDYLSRLNDDGLILFHISSWYYDLRPVIKSISSQLMLFGATSPPIEEKKKLEGYQSNSICVVLARDPDIFSPLIDRGWIMFNDKDGLPKVTPWTDDYINILVPLMLQTKKLSKSLPFLIKGGIIRTFQRLNN
ncbi:MAG: spermidine synthase [Candidatus Thorarchaeota archaeon]